MWLQVAHMQFCVQNGTLSLQVISRHSLRENYSTLLLIEYHAKHDFSA